MRSVANGLGKIETDKLLIHLDAANEKSYFGTGTIWNNLKNTNGGVTLNNSPSFNTDIKSFTFDGIDDYGSFNSSDWSIFDIPTFTVCAWVYPLYFEAQGTVIFSYKDSARLLLGCQYGYYGGPSTGGIYFRVVGSSATLDSYTAIPSVVLLNTWLYYTFVVDLPGQNIKGYVNGSEVYSNTNNYGTDFATYVGGYGPALASRYGGISNNANMKIATFSFYNKVLSASEVSQNYNVLKNRFGL